MKTVTYDETQWQLVPKVATDDMEQAAIMVGVPSRSIADKAYEIMLSAAPRRGYANTELAAPIPPEPTPSQQEALNDLRELDTNFEFEGRMAVLRNHLHHFILARPDAVQWQPIETCPKDGSSFLAWKAGRFNCVDHVVWYAGTVLQPSNEQRDAITHWMPLPTRPDEVTK